MSGPSSQSRPSHRRSSIIDASDFRVDRSTSVSSILRTNVPPDPRANSQLKIADALVGLALDADAIDRDAEHVRQPGTHRVDVRRQLRALENHGRVDVADGETAFADDLHGTAQQVDARRALPLRIRVRKMPADV